VALAADSQRTRLDGLMHLSACPSCGVHLTVELHRRRVNIAQAAEIAGVTTRTIQNWVRANRVEWVRTAAPRGVRIYVDTLHRVSPRD
jgi:hypothetical protein